jgi:hypothetical protein
VLAGVALRGAELAEPLHEVLHVLDRCQLRAAVGLLLELVDQLLRATSVSTCMTKLVCSIAADQGRTPAPCSDVDSGWSCECYSGGNTT